MAAGTPVQPGLFAELGAAAGAGAIAPARRAGSTGAAPAAHHLAELLESLLDPPASTPAARRARGAARTSRARADQAAIARGLALPEVLAATGHERASIAVVLGYFDEGRSRQGELARLVAGTVVAGSQRASGDIRGPDR